MLSNREMLHEKWFVIDFVGSVHICTFIIYTHTHTQVSTGALETALGTPAATYAAGGALTQQGRH